jgi:hypothetical protein
MFNIHKHISHLIFVLVPECVEYEICNQKIILKSLAINEVSQIWNDKSENCGFFFISILRKTFFVKNIIYGLDF